ncbi:UNVERIFIED_CONTAM: hypothetical protein IGO34_34680, partial [Salmonella enterica subsp. enterica serovar Weltevreden]
FVYDKLGLVIHSLQMELHAITHAVPVEEHIFFPGALKRLALHIGHAYRRLLEAYIEFEILSDRYPWQQK